MEICAINDNRVIPMLTGNKEVLNNKRAILNSRIIDGFQIIFFLTNENDQNQLFHVFIGKAKGSNANNFKITVIPESKKKGQTFKIPFSTKIGDVFAYIQHSLLIGNSSKLKNVQALNDALIEGRKIGLDDKSKEMINTASMEDMLNLLMLNNLVIVKNSQNHLYGISLIIDEKSNNNYSNESALLLNKIESELKQLIHSKMSPSEINSVLTLNLKKRDRKAIDQNWMELKYVFEKSEIWDRMKWIVDRNMFIELLNEINRIVRFFKSCKNAFISEKDKSLLYDSVSFLNKLKEMSV